MKRAALFLLAEAGREAVRILGGHDGKGSPPPATVAVSAAGTEFRRDGVELSPLRVGGIRMGRSLINRGIFFSLTGENMESYNRK